MNQLTTFTEYFKQHQGDFDAILFDIDGTLSLGKVPIPGAAELLEYLEKISFPYLLLTNDSCNSPQEKSAYLVKSGIPAMAQRILSAGNALTLWAEDNYRGGKFFLLGKMGNPSYPEAAGMEFTAAPEDAGMCCGVLCGEGIYDWRKSVEAAFNLLWKHPEYPLIVANPDSYWTSMRAEGMGIGAGAVARFICQVLADAGKHVEPYYLGKPFSPVYQCVFPFLRKTYPDKKFSDPARLLTIGDSLKSDISGANANGMTGALVMSGITTDEILNAATPEQQPKLVFRSV
jgi:HAD superfamily hydrolase (TIGR01450 family)